MILDAFRLDGRVALVTGAARGIGQAVALALAEAGADIAVLDRADLAGTAAEIRARNRGCHSIHSDLNDAGPARLAGVIQECVDRLGRLDILVNNAGIVRRAPATETQPEDWNAVLAINLTATFFLSQAAAHQYLAVGQRGKIINLASMLSFHGGVDVPAYTAAKSGVAGLTRALANEWAGHGINVNAIAPGWIATEFTRDLRADAERYRSIHSRIPAGRWGEPVDLQGAAVFLASDASSYVHGAIIPVDGGWLAW